VIQGFARNSGLLSEIHSPVRDWCRNSGDEWLTRLLLERLDSIGGSWEEAVAVGTYARLRRRPREETRAAIDSILAGGVDEDLARPRRWARSLSAEQVRTIEDLGFSVIERLQGEIEDLGRSVDESDPRWRAAFMRICRERDDLAGIQLVLVDAGTAEDFSSALSNLDEQAGRLAGRLGTTKIPDVRLRRVALAEPGAWWAEIAQV
jgi:hypothetical protein